MATSNNMINPAVDPDAEDELFAREVEQVKAWWSEPRWRQTRRPFTAEQIVSKRGHLRIEYPSNAQSKKLWDILERRFQVSLGRKSMSPAARTCGTGRTSRFADSLSWGRCLV